MAAELEVSERLALVSTAPVVVLLLGCDIGSSPPALYCSFVTTQARSTRSSSEQHPALGTTPATAVVAAVQSTTSASADANAAAEEADEEEPETMPLLARRVMAGRQSIVPGHSKVITVGNLVPGFVMKPKRTTSVVVC